VKEGGGSAFIELPEGQERKVRGYLTRMSWPDGAVLPDSVPVWSTRPVWSIKRVGHPNMGSLSDKSGSMEDPGAGVR
jgi:hypothetical protein